MRPEATSACVVYRGKPASALSTSIRAADRGVGYAEASFSRGRRHNVARFENDAAFFGGICCALRNVPVRAPVRLIRYIPKPECNRYIPKLECICARTGAID
jgi:hypothetical protein